MRTRGTADLVIGALAEAIDGDDFRDKHERAMRDHVLGAPEDHVCDDLCSGPIIDRLLLGRSRQNEYPPKMDWAAALRTRPVEHMPQSTHGCVNCDRKWYEHTPEEKGRWA